MHLSDMNIIDLPLAELFSGLTWCPCVCWTSL